MRTRMGTVGALLIGLVLAGCSSGTDETSGSSSPEQVSSVGSATALSASSPESSSAASPESSPAAGSSAPGTTDDSAGPDEAFGLCPAVALDDLSGMADCVHDDLVEFWQRETGEDIDRPVVIEPEFPPEPRECFAPQQYYAWYCSDNSTIYINTSMLDLWEEHFSPDEVPYSLAATLAHEVGHAAQFALDPTIADKENEDGTLSPEDSLPVELQADCLAGVWAATRIADGRLDRATFLAVWKQETELLSTPEHDATHGTSPERIEQTEIGLDQGLAGCGLG